MGNSVEFCISLPPVKAKPMSAQIQNFLGSYDYSLDEKGRLSIPVKFRKVMSRLQQDLFIISTLEDTCLTLYPYGTWQESVARKLDGLPQIDDDANELRRLLGLSTTDVGMDNQGRITIPPHFCQHAKIEKGVKIIGCTNKIELWNPEVYEAFSQRPDAKSLKEELKKYRI